MYMYLLKYAHQMLMVAVVLSDIRPARGTIKIPGTSALLFDFRKLGCDIKLDETSSVHEPSIASCCRSCTETPSCSTVHYNEERSLCLIDTSPANTLVEDASVNGTWRSYLQYKYYCQDPWTQFAKSCYHVPENLFSSTDCETYCQGMSSYMATIQSEYEMVFVNDIIDVLPQGDKFLLIGGKQNDDNYAWSWSNGEPWGYTKWYPNEPSSTSETCLAIFYRNTNKQFWNDLHCLTLGYCLCEKSAVTESIEPPAACVPIS